MRGIMIVARTFFLVTGILVFLSSCSSVMVSQDFDPSVSYKQYDSFALGEKDPDRDTDPRYDNDLINNRFNRTITTVLQGKGFAYAERITDSDLTISYDYSVRPKMDLYNINRQVGFSYGSYNRYGGIGAKTCTDISEFDQGVLFITIKDTRTNKLIWRGTATDIVSIHATPEKISNQVEEMVSAVLDDFPPE